jgi:hypothetical protein
VLERATKGICRVADPRTQILCVHNGAEPDRQQRIGTASELDDNRMVLAQDFLGNDRRVNIALEYDIDTVDVDHVELVACKPEPPGQAR